MNFLKIVLFFKKSILLIFLTLIICFDCFTQSFSEVTFPSSDGLLIKADFYIKNKNAPTILMFHQSVSSRGEYRDIAPKLRLYGYNCIAVDLRWGRKDFWNKIANETARRNGTYPIVENYEDTEDYQLNKVWPIIFKAYFDMEATLEYLQEEGYVGKKIVMGSSFSAMLAFKLAAENKEVAGLLTFSPGEYHPTQDSLLGIWSKKINIPVYISAGKGQEEYEMTHPIFKSLPPTAHHKFHQSAGRHGASVLIKQPQDWPPLLAFLKSSGFNKVNTSIGHKVIEYKRDYDIKPPNATTSNPINHKLIPLNLWYPIAESSSGNLVKMTYKDYISKLNKEKSISENKALFTRMVNSFGTIDTIHKEAFINDFLSLETPILNAPAYPNKKYPIVMICGAHPFYHIDLAETIASNGFVVASFPRLGKKQGERLSFSKEGSAEFKNDLNFVISSLMKQPFVDSTQLSFITWSFEGIPTYEVAISNNNTKRYISLDSSLGYNYGKNLIQDATELYKQKLMFPLIHYTNSSMDFGKDLSFLMELKKLSDKIEIDRTIDLNHPKFTSMGAITLNKINKEKENPLYNLLLQEVITLLEDK